MLSDKNISVYNFPDELIPNEKEFAVAYASAIWGEWQSEYFRRKTYFHKLRAYADGNQPIDACKKNIQRKYIKEEFMNINWEYRLKILPQALRNYRN